MTLNHPAKPQRLVARNGNRGRSKFARVNFHAFVMLLILGAISLPMKSSAQQTTNASSTSAAEATAHDGQHDFDFEIGTWKTTVTRLVHPLTGSTTWVKLEGLTRVHKIWDGLADLAELEADTPAGKLRFLSLRLYNPESHQWSLNVANSRVGVLTVPTVGAFKNGRGEFYDQEPINGRMILVRNIWSDITPNSCHFEQAFSDDGGKTWEVNWIAEDTRM